MILGFRVEEYIHPIDKNTKETVSQLATLLAEEEPDRINDFTMFWKDWFQDKQKGNRFTIIAKEAAGNKIIGVARFWQSPYCDNKWLIEGLQVLSCRRGEGVGKSLVKNGIKLLKEKDVEYLYVHILRGNVASESLHKSVGFTKIAKGINNSLGFFRQNIDEYCLRLK